MNCRFFGRSTARHSATRPPLFALRLSCVVPIWKAKSGGRVAPCQVVGPPENRQWKRGICKLESVCAQVTWQSEYIAVWGGVNWRFVFDFTVSVFSLTSGMLRTAGGYLALSPLDHSQLFKVVLTALPWRALKPTVIDQHQQENDRSAGAEKVEQAEQKAAVRAGSSQFGALGEHRSLEFDIANCKHGVIHLM